MITAIQKPTIKPKPFGKQVRDGLWLNMPAPQYHGTPHLSSTLLRVLMRSPLEYKRTIDRLIVKQCTDAMDYGTAAHAAILENRFDAFHIQPETYGDGKPWNGNATECKQWRAVHEDKPIITTNQVQELSASAEYVRQHHKASKLLRGGNVEVSAFHDNTKARCDYLTITGESARVVDLKTCADASTEAFAKEIINRGYHIQFAWYRRVLRGLGLKHFQFFFIALQKGQLPLVNVWEMHPLAMDMADKKIDDALDMLAKCITNKYWPEWSDYDGENEIKTIDVPEWAYSGGAVELEFGGETVEV